MESHHRIILTACLAIAIVMSTAGLVLGGLAFSRSNEPASSLLAKNDEAAMTWLAGKATLGAARFGSKLVIPSGVSKLWHYVSEKAK